MLILAGTHFFAKPFEGGENMVDAFMSKGQYVKVCDDYVVMYFSRSSINAIAIGEEGMGIHMSDGNDIDIDDLNIEEYSFSLDGNCNIIVKKK